MLWPIMHALHYIGFSVLEPFLVYGVRGGLAGEALQAQNAALAQVTQTYRDGLNAFSTWPAVPFNRSEDFDADLALKPGAGLQSVRAAPRSGLEPGLQQFPRANRR